MALTSPKGRFRPLGKDNINFLTVNIWLVGLAVIIKGSQCSFEAYFHP